MIGFALLLFSVVRDHDVIATTAPYQNAYSIVRRFGGWEANRTPVRFGTAITLENGRAYSILANYMVQAYGLFFYWLNENHGGIRINGDLYPVELIFVNDESQASYVDWATDKLVNDFNINLLFGPYSSGLTNNAAAVANTSGATMLCSGAASAFVFEGRPQVFGTSTPADQWLRPAITMFAGLSHPPKTVALIQEDVGFTKFACSSIPDLAAANNMTIVYQATVSSGANISEISTVVGAMSTASPDVVFSCNYDVVCKNLVRASKSANFNPKAFVLTTCVPGIDFIQDLGMDGLYVLGTAAWTEKVAGFSDITNLSAKQFYDMYEERFEEPPHYLSAAAFAGASLYVHAIQTTNSTDPKIVADAIRAMDVQTEYGRVQFDDIGLCKKNYSIVEWKDTAKTTIVDATSTDEPLYPKPTWPELRCLDPAGGMTVYGYNEQGLNCGRCPVGEAATFENVTNKRICRSCPIGQKLVTTGDIGECQMCEAGKFWCGEGWYSPVYSDHIASDLRESSYCDVTVGYHHCRDCPPGRYSDGLGLTLCKECQPGKYQNVPGKTACTECRLWDRRYPTAYSAVSNSLACDPCPTGGLCELDFVGLYSSYTNADDYYLVEANPLDYGSDLALGKLFKCPHGEGKSCMAKGRCYVDVNSDEVSMEGPFCGDCKVGFARGENYQLCTKCGPTMKSWALGFAGACIIFVVSAWLLISQLLKDPRAMLPGMYVILRQFMNYVHICTVVIPSAHFSSVAESFFEKLGGFAYVSAAASPLSAATGTECYLRDLLPDADIYQVWIIAGFSLVPMWLLFDACLYSLMWVICRLQGLPTPNKQQLVLGIALNLYVLQPRLTKLFLIPFDCIYLDSSRLMAKLSVKCDDGIIGWQILSILGLMVYSFGIPFALIGTLYSFRKSNQLQSVECARMFGFLFQGFKPGYYYWEAILMMRKVLFQIIAYIPWLAPVGEDVDTQKAMTSLSLLLLTIIFLLLHLKCKPYDFRDFRIFHEIETAMLWAVLITTLSTTWLYVSRHAWVFTDSSENMQRNQNVRDSMVTIVVVLFHLRFFGLVIWGVIGGSIRATQKWQKWTGGNTIVEITENGMKIDTLSIEARIFLSDLIKEAALGTMQHEYFFLDDLRDAVKQLSVETFYQKDILNFEASLPFLQQQLRGCWFWLPKSVRENKYVRRLEEKVMENITEEDDCPWRHNPYNFVWNPAHYKRAVGSTFSVEDMLLAYVNIAWRQDGRRSKQVHNQLSQFLSDKGVDRNGEKTAARTRSLLQEVAQSDETDSPAALNSLLPNDVPLQLGKAADTVDVNGSSKKAALPGVVIASSDNSDSKHSLQTETLQDELLNERQGDETATPGDSDVEQWS